MAAGGDAQAAGMDIVASTAKARLGYDEINKSRDYVAQRAKRTSPTIDIWVQTGDPGHAVGRVWIHPA